MTIRAYTVRDAPAIIRLFTETVHTVNIKDYSPEQVEAWAPASPDVERWHIRLGTGFTVVAELDRELVGFAKLAEYGYLDLLYVHHRYLRRGIGRALLTAVIEQARSQGIAELQTESSITARAFFESNGFVVVREQFVMTRGTLFTNFAMVRTL